ncbi:unnamed protein product, partial [Symbiodinium sp. KB8]
MHCEALRAYTDCRLLLAAAAEQFRRETCAHHGACVYAVQVLSSVDLTGLFRDSAGHYRALESVGTVGQVEASVTDEVLGLVPETWPPQAVFLAAAVPGSLAPRFGHAARRGVRRGDELCGVNGRLVRSFEVAEDLARELRKRPTLLTFQRSSDDVQGAGGASRPLLGQLKTVDLAFGPNQATLGLIPETWPPGPVQLGAVVPGSPASRAGTQVGDILLMVNDMQAALLSPEDLSCLLRQRPVSIRLLRGPGAFDAVNQLLLQALTWQSGEENSPSQFSLDPGVAQQDDGLERLTRLPLLDSSPRDGSTPRSASRSTTRTATPRSPTSAPQGELRNRPVAVEMAREAQARRWSARGAVQSSDPALGEDANVTDGKLAVQAQDAPAAAQGKQESSESRPADVSATAVQAEALPSVTLTNQQARGDLQQLAARTDAFGTKGVGTAAGGSPAAQQKAVMTSMSSPEASTEGKVQQLAEEQPARAKSFFAKAEVGILVASPAVQDKTKVQGVSAAPPTAFALQQKAHVETASATTPADLAEEGATAGVSAAQVRQLAAKQPASEESFAAK